MNREDESWRELCERASKEQDPQKLVALVERINRILEAREKKLRRPGDGVPDVVLPPDDDDLLGAVGGKL
jgi:hypothetical protein